MAEQHTDTTHVSVVVDTLLSKSKTACQLKYSGVPSSKKQSHCFNSLLNSVLKFNHSLKTELKRESGCQSKISILIRKKQQQKQQQKKATQSSFIQLFKRTGSCLLDCPNDLLLKI